MTEGVSDGKEAGGGLKMNQETRENMRLPDNGRTTRIESRACLSATCAYVCVFSLGLQQDTRAGNRHTQVLIRRQKTDM